MYAYTDGDMTKHNISKRWLETDDTVVVISTQVLNELYVTLAKYKIPHDKIVAIIDEVSSQAEVVPVSSRTVKIALAVKNRYDFSYWDSLILATSLESGCALLISEDLSNKQVVDGSELQIDETTNVRTTIRNPFA